MTELGTDEALEDVDWGADLPAEGVETEQMPCERAARRWRQAEQAELRRALGVDDASGYHVVDEIPSPGRDGAARGDMGPCVSDPRGGPGAPPLRACFPCLSGVRYTGCLGMACELETCWTGGATVSAAYRHRMRSRVSTALYLPGAPCHTCVHVQDEDESAASLSCPTVGEGVAPGRRAKDGKPRRVTCARGLWAHPISLASFVTKRIPMCDPYEPQSCPGYASRVTPHPAVAERLRLRRERAQRRRAEGRERDGE